MIERTLTKPAARALSSAMSCAHGYGHSVAQPLHLALVLCASEEDSVGARVCERAGENSYINVLQESLQEVLLMKKPAQKPKMPLSDVGMSVSLSEMIQNATRAAAMAGGDGLVGLDRLLLQLFDDHDAKNCFLASGWTKQLVESILVDMRKGNNNNAAATKTVASDDKTAETEAAEDESGETENNVSEEHASTVVEENTENSCVLLDKYGSLDLIRLTTEDKLDPVIGRDDKIRRLIHLLSRRTKNNPCLVGEPGVGKNAIVRGLARRIVARDVPESLRGIGLRTLPLVTFFGAQNREELGKRIEIVLNESKQTEKGIIWFVDEFHMFMGPQRTEIASEAVNLLTPLIAKGDLRIVGATTLEKHRQNTGLNFALERHFQDIFVEESTVEDTVSILRCLTDKYQSFHRVRISDAALNAAARLSDRYVSQQFLPAKAIDLIDETAAICRAQLDCKPESIEKLEQQIFRLEVESAVLEREADESSARLRKIAQDEMLLLEEQLEPLRTKWNTEMCQDEKIKETQEKIARLEAKAAEAERAKDYDKAADLKYGAIPDLKLHLETIVKLEEDRKAKLSTSSICDDDDDDDPLPPRDPKEFEKLLSRRKAKLKNLEAKLASAERNHEDDKASELKNKRIPEAKSQLNSLIEEQEKRKEQEKSKNAFAAADGDVVVSECVTEHNVAQLVSRWTGISIEKILQSQQDRLQNLDEKLSERVFGQDNAIREVVDSLWRATLGLPPGTHPMSSFLFIGPPSCGKTELAKALCSELYDKEEGDIVRIDLSEYTEPQSFTRLIGPPSGDGYTDSDVGGELTEPVRRNPHAVVVFTDAENAHKRVLTFLLQILEKGRLLDIKGRHIDFSNAIIIFRSNLIGTEVLEASQQDGSKEAGMEESVMRQVQSYFGDDFLIRLSAIVVFDALGASPMKKICQKAVRKVQERMEAQGIRVVMGKSAAKAVVEASSCTRPSGGARSVERFLQQNVFTALSRLMIKRELSSGMVVHIEVHDESDKSIDDCTVHYLEQVGKLTFKILNDSENKKEKVDEQQSISSVQ